MTDSQTIKLHLEKLKSTKPLEDYCTQCGECCLAGITYKSKGTETRIQIPQLPCKFLEQEGDTYSCGVYENRFEKASWCADLEAMLAGGYAPDDCPYTEGLEGYSPTKRISAAQYSTLVPLFRLAISQGLTEAYNDSDLENFLSE